MVTKALVPLLVVAVIAGAAVGVELLRPSTIEATGHSATRSFSDTSVLPGGQLEVTITAADYGGFGRVDETLPDGFSFVSSTLDVEEGAVTVDGQVAKFRLLGDDEFTYTVTATTTPDDYTFSGVLRDDNAEARDVGGEDTVTVEAEAVTTPDATSTPTSSPVPMPTGPRASRSFSDTSVLPGGQLEVTITAADYGGFGRVDETLPDGFTFVSSTLDAEVGAVTVDGQLAKFRLLGDDEFTYTVTATSTAGDYDFSGVLRDDDADTHDVGGADTVTVAAATPTPTSTATPEPTVAPDEPTTDADMVTNVRIGRVRETLITLSWDALDGAAAYKVQWKSGRRDWSEGRQLETSSTAITLRRLKPSTEYSVRVSATDVGTWSEAVTASTEGPDDDTGSPFPTMTPTPTATPEAPPPTPIPPTTMIATSTAATLMSADGTVTLELPADARSEAYQVNFESVSGCAYTGAKADVTFTCVKALIFDAEDMLETDVAFDAAPTIAFHLSAEQVKALGGEFLLTKLHEMGGLMIITRASDDAAWTALAGTTLTIDDETGGAVLAGWPASVTTFTAVADQAAYDAIQEMYAHLLPRPMLAPPTGGPSIPGVALLALLLGSVALLSAGWILTARRSGA